MTEQDNQCRALIRQPVFSPTFRETIEFRYASYAEKQTLLMNATIRAMSIPASMLNGPSSYSSFRGLKTAAEYSFDDWEETGHVDC